MDLNIDLSKIKRIHFVGIKGVAMTALAIHAKERGKSISGSDLTDEFPTDETLKKSAIRVFRGFAKKHIRDLRPQLVIYTGAHGGNKNEEVRQAKALGIPALPHGKALGLFMSSLRQISVAGCHGKTTTTAMIATILTYAGLSPSYTIGCGSVFGLGKPGHFGKGDWFVAEADEYVTDPGHDTTSRFLWQNPEILVVTNIDFDHPDVFASLAGVQSAFLKFKEQKQKESLKLSIVNIDDPPSKVLLTDDDLHEVTYGLSPQAHFRIENIRSNHNQTFFWLNKNGVSLGEFSINLAGRHNVYNATASIAAGDAVGIKMEVIREGLRQFSGTKRRFEYLGKYRQALFYDDYAHHPAEIRSTLAAARSRFNGKRIIVIFQPHTYSRTQALLFDFAKSFSDADSVLITDIYASAREKKNSSVSSQKLVEETAKNHLRVFYKHSYSDVKEWIERNINPTDVLFFMGAGNIYTWAQAIIENNGK